MNLDVLQWVICGALLVAGGGGAIAIYLGKRDPKTRAYLPSIAAEFQLGRVRTSPDPAHESNNDDQRYKGAKDQEGDRSEKQ